MSLSEPFQKPSTMLYRNFLAMETEEFLRSYPIDGAVLMGGCDKTTPALLMGAISMDLPAIFVPAGPMLRGNWRGNTLGSGSDVWKYWDEKRAGTIGESEWQEIEDGIARSPGHCMTMGTASTMTAVAEVLGMTLPGASSILAADSSHPRMASMSGRRIVEMVWDDLKPSDILDDRSYEDAVTAVMALGGSTNAVIHLIALARRSGVPLNLARFDEISRRPRERGRRNRARCSEQAPGTQSGREKSIPSPRRVETAPTTLRPRPSSPDTRPRPMKVATSISSQRDNPFQSQRFTDPRVATPYRRGA
jgi:dihydroxyacid dehydratase/phosphogluconate dehydratase